MDGLFTLLSLCVVMAAASFAAGILPLALKLSASQLRLISTIGMGVLVGTSLIVIIPEGVDTLYSSVEAGHVHKSRTLINRGSKGGWMPVADVPVAHVRSARSAVDSLHGTPGPVLPDSIDPFPPETPTVPGVVGVLEHGGRETSSSSETSKEGAPETKSHHAWVGVALIAGFVLMFLVDKLPEHTSTSKPRARTHHIALNNLGRRFNLTTTLDRDDEADSFLENVQTTHAQSRSFATTTGLVIHAAADGIALGASSSASNTDLSFVIFFAIMVHKAPAAFGLTSVLLKQGLSKRMARAHLAMFSLAAPTGAVLTWMLARLLGAGGRSSPADTHWWTGMLLLFSAGTFLYVAMHSMQEVSGRFSEKEATGHANGSFDGRDTSKPEPPSSLRDVGAACFGMILPLFLQVGHAH